MSKRTVTLKIEVPHDLAELLAGYGDQLMTAMHGMIREAQRVSNSGEIADIIRRVEAKSDARRALVLSIGRTAHRIYRARLKNKPKGLSTPEASDWRATVQSDIAQGIGHPHELVEVALSQHRNFLRNRLHSRRLIYVLRAGQRGEDKNATAKRFAVGVTTIHGLFKKAKEIADTKGVSLAELEEFLTATRRAEIRSLQPRHEVDQSVIDFSAIKITRETL